MVSKHRDIKERTFSFAVRILTLCRDLDRKRGTDQILARQLFRAGTSIGANVEEAQARQSKADFISKCNIALKKARETIYWLRLLRESGDSSNEACSSLLKEADEIARIIGSIIVNTRNHVSHGKVRRQKQDESNHSFRDRKISTNAK